MLVLIMKCDNDDNECESMKFDKLIHPTKWDCLSIGTKYPKDRCCFKLIKENDKENMSCVIVEFTEIAIHNYIKKHSKKSVSLLCSSCSLCNFWMNMLLSIFIISVIIE